MAEIPTTQYPEPPPELSGRFNWRMIGYFGAGAILASVTIGSGETVFSSRGGAVFGYSLLWCFVIGAIAKGVQVYTAARYITLTGEHPIAHWGYMPGPRNWVPLFIGVLSIFCFPFFLSGLPLILGELVTEVTSTYTPGDPEYNSQTRWWATAAAAIAIVLTAVQSYGVLEKIQTLIVGLLLFSLLVACVVAQPDWMAAIWGTLIPTRPSYEPWVLIAYADDFADRSPWVEVIVYLGAIGGGTYDYLGYIGCLREKRWGAIGTFVAQRANDGSGSFELQIDTSDANLARARRWLRAPSIDVGVSFGCVLLFSVCFVLLGAAILHPQHKIPAGEGELLTHQAEFLTAMHPSLLHLYRLGVFMAFWGTIYGAFEIYLRTAYECLAPLSRKVRAMPTAQFRLAGLAYCGTGAMILIWTETGAVDLVTFPALLGGVVTCGLWCFAMLWVDTKMLPRPLRMGTLLRVLTILSGFLLTGLGVKSIWDYASDWWG